jgi:ketosteroid isomerase-like protein
MKAVAMCILLATIFPLSHAQSASHESDKARVLSLENAWNEAEKHKDAKAVDALLAPSFAYTDSEGSFMNKAQFLASISSLSYHPDQIINEAMNAEPYEHAVIVTGIYREQGSEKGKPYTRRGRFTDVWIQENGAWLCAASQETLITH